MIDIFHKNKKLLFGENIPWLQKLRDESFAYFLNKEADSLRKILEKNALTCEQFLVQSSVSFATDFSKHVFNKDLLGQYRLQQKSILLVFVDGIFNAELSDDIGLESEIVCLRLSEALEAHEKVIRPYFNNIKFSDQLFTSLNLALMNDGLFLHIPQNIRIKDPIHFLFVSSDHNKFVANVHNLIVVEPNSQVNFFEEHLDLGKSQHFCNTFTNLTLGEKAEVNYFKSQHNNKLAKQIANLQIEPKESAKLNTHHIINGAAFSRDHIYVKLKQEHIFCKLKGLYLADGTRHVDFHTRVEHDCPNCTSIELFKGVIQDEAFANFSGRVFVAKNAIKSEAHLTNRNLLLSDQAQIKTSPELEIYADDVNCSHGATVGQLEEQMLFYLRARGIDEVDAQKLLVQAFINEVTSDFITGITNNM